MCTDLLELRLLLLCHPYNGGCEFRVMTHSQNGNNDKHMTKMFHP